MGFGHAVYQVEDPRAKHLKRLSERLGKEQGETRWYEMSVEMERLVTAAIGKNCNVDFYSASVQHYLGIPKEMFTCIFAASRIAGWVRAHPGAAWGQQDHPSQRALHRPRAAALRPRRPPVGPAVPAGCDGRCPDTGRKGQSGAERG